MAVPPRGRRAGKIEIDNKEREAREKAKQNKTEQKVTPEEEAERIRILKEAGLLK